ncbi:TetR/AcrR family transcriptional regulator [Zhongshania arctica]|uniref:TetR/AcrR family transcriptional regulator n=1 Tax=Zhongshania arctica TaxID=3238302 RepID=A0ABV3TV77_9GAMM
MRRQPKQQRSRLIVRDIVQAAREHLNENGLEGFNTSAVANRTGVSVGTMYQYFENKEQLLDAVSLTLAEEIKEQLDLVAGSEILSGFRDFSRVLISSIIFYVGSQPLLIRALLSSDAERRLSVAAEKIEGHFTDVFRNYALQHHSELPNTNLPSAVFVVFTSILAVTLRMQIIKKPGIDHAAITDMLVESALATVFGSNYEAP